MKKRKVFPCGWTWTSSNILILPERDGTVTEKKQKINIDSEIFSKTNQPRLIVVVYAYICLLKA